MLVGRVDNINRQRYNSPHFQGGNPFKFYSCKLSLADGFVRLIEESRMWNGEQFQNSPAYRAQLEVLENAYKDFQEENERIFMEHVKPSCKEIVKNLLELPTYTKAVLPFAIELKPSELKHLYELAAKKDITGEMRIPGVTFHYFSQIPEERLKMLEPLMLSKNDAGMWNYSPSFILQLNERFTDYQINIMSRLADCKVNGMNLRQIALNPFINHEKTIEKAQALKRLYGEDLREIEFLSNRRGENFLSADIQLPHREDKPDYMNFKRVFSLLDNDVNPVAKKTKMTEIDEYIDKIYKSLERKLHVFTADDLDKSIRDVKAAVPDAEEVEILRTMQKLTQFANYGALQKISQNVSHDIHPSGGINPYFYYFSKKKYIFDVPKSDGGIKSSFITKDDIHNKEFHKLLKRAQGNDIEWINLEGWADGVNMFSDDKTLTEKTIKVLKRAKKLQAKNEDYTFNDALSIILNREVISDIKTYGFTKVKTITFDTPATRNVILEQMQPTMPTRSLLKSTIESVSQYYTNSTKSKKFKNMCMKIAEYYQENLQVYSKQRIIESLKELNESINRYARICGVKSPERIYYVVPNAPESEYKSFNLITYMYKELFNIPHENIIKLNTFKDVNKYPKNSVFVVLDDIVGSGDSMTKLGEYRHCAKEISKDKHIFFCPVSATQKGLNFINSDIEHANRTSVDYTLSIYANTSSNPNIATSFIIDGNKKLNSEVLGQTGHCNAGLCNVFPYMGPDNDSELASYIIKFFVPDKRCIKNKAKVLPVIERNTYFYDIFGTDEQHILTNAKRVYTPDIPGRITAFFKNLFGHKKKTITA